MADEATGIRAALARIEKLDEHGVLMIPDKLEFTETDDDFVEQLMVVMTEAMSEDFEPCCDLFGRTLHHHWGRPS